MFDVPEIPAPVMPDAPPPPVLAGPKSNKPKKRSAQPSFLGTEATPDTTTGTFQGKTFLGQ